MRKRKIKIDSLVFYLVSLCLLVIITTLLLTTIFQDAEGQYPMVTILFGGYLKDIDRLLAFNPILIIYSQLLIFVPLFAIILSYKKPVATAILIVYLVQIASLFFFKEIINASTGLITEYFDFNVSFLIMLIMCFLLGVFIAGYIYLWPILKRRRQAKNKDAL